MLRVARKLHPELVEHARRVHAPLRLLIAAVGDRGQLTAEQTLEAQRRRWAAHLAKSAAEPSAKAPRRRKGGG